MANDLIGQSELLGPGNADNNLRGLEYLGGWENPEGSAAVATSGIVSFGTRDTILVMARISWAGAAGHMALRIGTAPGVIDSGPNIWSRNAISRGRDTGALGNSDGGLFFGTRELNATQFLLQGTTDNGGIGARVFLVHINNGLGMPKTATWMMSRSTGAAATNGPIASGWGEYVNPNSQVRCVQFATRDGAASIGPDSGFGVFGRSQV